MSEILIYYEPEEIQNMSAFHSYQLWTVDMPVQKTGFFLPNIIWNTGDSHYTQELCSWKSPCMSKMCETYNMQ